ncbi:MAG: hypothetical protein HRT43_08465 [Campylobacteraceae bacterium]|nr:hypothetical protein [Campylobacteraceae bacterium]
MKTFKYIAFALALAFALAGCVGGSGMTNFDGFDNSSPNDRSDMYMN